MAAGLREVCFTTHFDADPSRIEREGYIVIDGRPEKLTDEAVRHYLGDVARARGKYGNAGLLVRGGLEFGYFPGCEERIADLESKLDLDVRLGAVHNIDGLCLCYEDEALKLFGTMSLESLADRYFELLDACAASGLFDCLAHIDVYRRFGRAYYGEAVDTIHRGRIERLFATMNKHGIGYELNTSAIRHGLLEYYPGMDIVNMARAAGTPLITLGSDAHRPGDIALDFEAASAVAYELVPYVDE